MSTSYTKLSRPHPAVWQIDLTAPPDNRLTPDLFASLAANLDTVEAEWRKSSGKRDQQGPMSDPKTFGEHKGAGALVLTGSGRFFSNGLDYAKAMSNPRFFEETYDPVLYRLLTFPLYTIAAINGHAYAGGMVLALACDHRVITSGKGLMCMNELVFGSPIPNSFGAILRLRMPYGNQLRDTMLAKRWTQKDLLEAHLVDLVVEQDQVVSKAVELGVSEGAKVAGGAWGQIKDTMYHDIIDASRSNRPLLMPMLEAKAFWKRVGSQAKL